MKFTLHRLRLGDLVWAQVVDVVSPSEYIVSFQGDLVRVKNESLKPMTKNDKILVKVVALNPLAFQWLSDKDRKNGATRINITI